jgi:hypothetical protein
VPHALIDWKKKIRTICAHYPQLWIIVWIFALIYCKSVIIFLLL